MDIYNLPHIYELAFRVLPPLSIWRRKWEREVRRFLTTLPSPPSSVVDLCCGAGVLSPLIKQIYPSVRVLGIDRNRYMIKFARSHFPFAEFRCDDISKVDEKFDLLIMGGGLTTVALQDVIDTIRRITPSCFILSGYKCSIWSWAHRLFTKVVTGESYYTRSPYKIKEIFAREGIDVKVKPMDLIEGSYVIILSPLSLSDSA